MKIYIKELDLGYFDTNKTNKTNKTIKIEKIKEVLEKYRTKSANQYYMYCKNNIYKIYNNKIFKLEQKDKPFCIKKLCTNTNTNVDFFTLIMDKSKYIREEDTYNIPLKHQIIKIHKSEYKLTVLAELKFVIEEKIKSDKSRELWDYYFMLMDEEDKNAFDKTNIRKIANNSDKFNKLNQNTNNQNTNNQNTNNQNINNIKKREGIDYFKEELNIFIKEDMLSFLSLLRNV
jgi:hypothetical protein